MKKGQTQKLYANRDTLVVQTQKIDLRFTSSTLADFWKWSWTAAHYSFLEWQYVWSNSTKQLDKNLMSILLEPHKIKPMVSQAFPEIKK